MLLGALWPFGAELAPPPDTELGTDVVPDSMVAEFSSLTTPYCWVIIEDAVAGYDGPGGPALAHQPRRSTGHASSTRSSATRYSRSW